MSNPCTTCQPMPVCSEGLDRYSLAEDNYFFVYPPVTSWGTVTLLCCDGTVYSVTLPTEPTLQREALQAMFEECARKIPFCGTPDPDGPGGNDGSDVEGNGTVGHPYLMKYSAAKTSTISCVLGGSFSYTLPAGRFLGFNQVEVDQAAEREADRLAALYLCCLTDLPEEVCVDVALSEQVRVTGRGAAGVPSFMWSVVSGTLPTGCSFSGAVAGDLTGTPSTPGTYTFTLRAMTPSGFFGEREYTICVVGINNASPLPNGQKHVAYGPVTLTAVACAAAPLNWQVTVGTLPPGLTLDEDTGVISGTPTADGVSDFTVTLSTDTNACSKAFQITIDPAGCVDWSELAWPKTPPNPQVLGDGGGGGAVTASITPLVASADGFAASVARAAEVPFGAGVVNDGSLTYNGPLCSCNLHLVVDVDNTGDFSGSVQVYANGVPLLTVAPSSLASGAYDYPFDIPDTLGADHVIEVYVIAQISTVNWFPGHLTFSGQLTSV